MILHPLAQVLMYALILSAVLSTKLPGINSQYSYALYITAGIAAWALFSELVNRCLTLFLDNANLLKKVMFPRICLPLIVSGTAVTNSIFLLLSIFMIYFFLGHQITWQILWLPVLLLLTMGLGLGLGLVLGVLNVFIRDVGQIVPILLQFGFWFTPIVYTINIIPEQFRDLLSINPMYHVVLSFQNVLVFQKPPDLMGLSFVTVFCLLLMLFSLFLFKKASPEMADEL